MSTLEVEIVGPTGATPTATVELARDGHGRFVSPKAETGTAPPLEVDAAPAAKPSMAQAVRDRIAAIQGRAPAKEAPPPAEVPKEEAPAEPAAEPEPQAAADEPADIKEDVPAGELVPLSTESAPPPEPAKAVPVEWEAEREELRGVAQRQRAIIERLEGEVAAAKKAPPTSSDRARLLDEAEALYYREPAKALRKIVAALNGFAEDSKDLDAEMTDVFIDLTSEVGGVTPDAGHAAKRTSALTRREWDKKSKREAADKPQPAEQSAPEAQGELTKAMASRSDELFKPLAEKYPHLARMAPLDGFTPGEVIWDLLDKGVKKGEFDPSEPDEALVAKAAKRAEEFYRARADKIRTALPSTATPGVSTKESPAAAPSTETKRQGNGRALSNADASVAPAKTPPPAKEPERLNFKSDAERRRWATRHLRGEK